MSTVNIVVDYGSIDFALRVIESIALSLLSILGITDPCTGYLRGLFPERCYDDIPIWFWPVCGILFAMVAVANFSSNNTIVLVIQFFIIVSYHPVSGFEPDFYVIIAYGVALIRMDSLLLKLSGTCGIILVKKLSSSATVAAALRSGIISILIIVRKLSPLPAVPAKPATSREIDYGDRV